MNLRSSAVVLASLLPIACVTSRQAAPETTLGHQTGEAGDGGPSSPVIPDPMTLPVEAQVDWIFDHFGIAQVIESDLASNLELYQVMLRILPPEAEEAVRLAAMSIPALLASDELLAPAKEHFIEHADSERLGAVFLWVSSELGRNWAGVSDAVMAGGREDADAATAWLGSFYASLDDDPSLQRRLALLRAIEEASGHGRAAMELVAASADALLDALHHDLPQEMRPRDEHVQVVRQAMRATMTQPALAQTIFDAQLYASRALELEELETVHSFYRNGPGEWFMDVLQGAKRKAGGALAQGLARNLSAAWVEVEGSSMSASTDQPEG